MPMDPIDRFSTSREVRLTPGASHPGSPRERRSAAADGFEISEEAVGQLAIHETVVAVREAAAKVSDVRPERVAEARSRIEQGYYERPEVRGSIVDALLRSFHQD